MEHEFFPPRRIGILLKGGLILVLSAAGGYFFLIATQDPSGLNFLLNMLVALFLFIPLPILVYRFYALSRAVYILRRDGLLIRWGLRREDIPLAEIEWIRPANELGFRLPLPWLRWPGAILGSRRLSELGQVEFLASDMAHLVLVATPSRVYAVSPDQINNFMKLFQEISELGSLTPLEAQSIYPRVFVGQAWEDQRSRWLILSGLGIGVILLALVAILIPGYDTIGWIGPEAQAPAERLLLLPILNGMVWLFNLVAGILLYRRGDDLVLAAYLLWGNSVLIGILLMIGSMLLIF